MPFTPVSLGMKDRMEAVRRSSGSTLYTYTFASLFAWQDSAGYRVCLSDGAFVVLDASRGEQAYLFPCGTEKGRLRLLDALLEGGSPAFYCVTDADRAFLERAYPDRFAFTDCRDDYPYLYDRDAQIALRGKEYKNLRHQIHLGRDVAKVWTTEPLCAATLDRALRINAAWAEARSMQDLADTAAAETALRHFPDLDLWGLLFVADGRDIAYAAGTFVTPEIFDIAFCKVLESACDCYIKWALYSALPPEVRTIDSEEDMGLPGLRTHKLLRRPKSLVRVWKATPKGTRS